MAFKYIDDAAFAGPQTDSPVASAFLTGIRDNLGEAHLERFSKGSDVAYFDVPRRLCSCEPVAYLLGFVQIEEPCKFIKVLLRTDGVVWSKDDAAPPAADTDAIRLFVSCCDTNGRVILPPTPDLWTSAPEDGIVSGLLLVTKATGETLSPMYARTYGLTGQVGVLLWLVSEVDASAESVKTITGLQSPGGIGLSSAIVPTTNPPERAVKIEYNIAEQTAEPTDGFLFQIGAMDFADNVAYLIPALPGSDNSVYTSAHNASIYTMGVLVLVGVCLRQVPDTLLTAPKRLFYNAQPITELSHVRLVSALQRVTGRRPASLHSHPPVAIDSTTIPRYHLIRSPYLGNEVDEAAWYPLAQSLVMSQFALADRNGWRAVVGIGVRRSSGFDTSCKFRLAAYNPATTPTLIYAGPTSTRPLLILPGNQYGLEWYALAHMIWGSVYFTQWQLRGALAGLIGAWSAVPPSDWSDYRAIQFVEVEIPEESGEDSLTYPCILRLEAQMEANGVHDIFVVAQNFAPRAMATL